MKQLFLALIFVIAVCTPARAISFEKGTQARIWALCSKLDDVPRVFKAWREKRYTSFMMEDDNTCFDLRLIGNVVLYGTIQEFQYGWYYERARVYYAVYSVQIASGETVFVWFLVYKGIRKA